MQLKAAYLPDWEESKTCLHVGVMEDSKEIWTAIIALLSSMILILWYQQSWVCWRQAWWLVNYCQAPGPVLVQCPGLVQCPDWIQGPNKGEDSGQTLHSKFKVIISKARTWSDTIIKWSTHHHPPLNFSKPVKVLSYQIYLSLIIPLPPQHPHPPPTFLPSPLPYLVPVFSLSVFDLSLSYCRVPRPVPPT